MADHIPSSSLIVILTNRLLRNPQIIDVDIWMDLFVNSSYGNNIGLMPLTSFSTFYLESLLDMVPYDDNLQEGEEYHYRLTRALGFMSDGNILSKKMVKKWPKFRFLNTFYHSVWFIMVITMLFLSCVTTLTRTSWSSIRSNRLTKSISTFITIMIENLCQLFGTAFGHSSLSRSTSLLTNVSNISWLMLSIIMLSAFSSVMLPFFMKPMPKEVVNSWEDLYNRKDLKIGLFRWSSMYQYIDYYKDIDEMAREFSTRVYDMNLLLTDDVDDEFAIKHNMLMPSYKHNKVILFLYINRNMEILIVIS